MIYAVVVLSVLLVLALLHAVGSDRLWRKEHAHVCDVGMKLAEENTKYRKLLKALDDEDPCVFDHHGDCQTHYGEIDGRCATQVSRDLLKGKSTCTLTLRVNPKSKSTSENQS